jgi:hypothetical protein
MSAVKRAASVAAVAAGATALYALLVPWVLRPWFLAADELPHVPGPAGVMIDSDLYLNVWILAWLAHAAVHAPTSLFDGNIYYPAAGTIIGSENMLAHLPVTALVLAWTGSALTMLKAYLLECFALSGLGMFLFVRHHTRSVAASLAAGALFTFTAFRVQTIPQPQYLGIGFLPLALLFVDLWVERRRAWHLVALALAVALQALSCVYIGFFTFITVPVYAAVRIGSARPARPVVAAASVLGALALAGLALLPLALPYARGRAEGVIPEHELAWIRNFSWSPGDYVSATFAQRAGWVTLAVVLVDLVVRAAGRARGRRLRTWGAERALWAAACVALLFSAGPVVSLPGGLDVPSPYRLLYDFVPGFSSLRTPLRFSLVVAAALAALAGFAFARLTERLPQSARLAVATAVALLAAFAAAPRPPAVMAAELGDDAPAAYRWLAQHKAPGTIVEVPAAAIEDDVIGNHRNGRYMVASTLHWRPLVNGYTAYPPPLASLLAAAVRELPDTQALATLVDSSDLRWVVVHRDALTAREAARWPEGEQIPGLVHVRSFGGTDIYDVRVARTRPWSDELHERALAPAEDTLEGNSTAPLAPECRAGRILSVDLPERFQPIPLPLRVPVRLENASACTWPALGVRPEGLVGLTYQWTSPSGVAGRVERVSRLLRDVPPGATVETGMMITPPSGEPGTWRIDVQLEQDGLAEPLARTTRSVVVLPPRDAARPAEAAAPS